MSSRVCACVCVFCRPLFVRTARLDDLQLTQTFWAAAHGSIPRGPGFLFLMQTTGLQRTMGISSDCKHRLFNLDSAQDGFGLLRNLSQVFMEFNSLSLASLSCYCSGDFSSMRTLYYRFSSLSLHYRLSDVLSCQCQVCFPWFLTFCHSPLRDKGAGDDVYLWISHISLLNLDLCLISKWIVYNLSVKTGCFAHASQHFL